jgi:hypothetical protein
MNFGPELSCHCVSADFHPILTPSFHLNLTPPNAVQSPALKVVDKSFYDDDFEMFSPSAVKITLLLDGSFTGVASTVKLRAFGLPPAPAPALVFVLDCLKRQLLLPVSTIWQSCVSLSSNAVVILASLKTCAHSAKLRFVVISTLVRSYSLESK